MRPNIVALAVACYLKHNRLHIDIEGTNLMHAFLIESSNISLTVKPLACLLIRSLLAKSVPSANRLIVCFKNRKLFPISTPPSELIFFSCASKMGRMDQSCLVNWRAIVSDPRPWSCLRRRLTHPIKWPPRTQVRNVLYPLIIPWRALSFQDNNL